MFLPQPQKWVAHLSHGSGNRAEPTSTFGETSMTTKRSARAGRKNLSGSAPSASIGGGNLVKIVDLSRAKNKLQTDAKPKATTVVNGRPHALNKPMASISDVGAAKATGRTHAKNKPLTNKMKPTAASAAGKPGRDVTSKAKPTAASITVYTICAEKPAAANRDINTKKALALCHVTAAIKAGQHQAARAA